MVDMVDMSLVFLVFLHDDCQNCGRHGRHARTGYALTMALNPRQAKFVDEFLLDFNATNAAIRAGYSPKAASAVSSRLLTNAKVANAVAARKKADAQKNEVTRERVLVELGRIAFADPRKMYNADGSIKNVTELDDETAAAVASVESIEVFEGTGDDRTHVGNTKKLKLADKVRALKLLGQHFGMFDNRLKVEHSGPGGKPIEHVHGIALIDQMMKLAADASRARDLALMAHPADTTPTHEGTDDGRERSGDALEAGEVPGDPLRDGAEEPVHSGCGEGEAHAEASGTDL